MAKPDEEPKKEMSFAADKGMTTRRTVRKTRKSPLVTRDSSQGSMLRNIFTTGGNSYLQMNKNEHMAPSVWIVMQQTAISLPRAPPARSAISSYDLKPVNSH